MNRRLIHGVRQNKAAHEVNVQRIHGFVEVKPHEHTCLYKPPIPRPQCFFLPPLSDSTIKDSIQPSSTSENLGLVCLRCFRCLGLLDLSHLCFLGYQTLSLLDNLQSFPSTSIFVCKLSLNSPSCLPPGALVRMSPRSNRAGQLERESKRSISGTLNKVRIWRTW